MRKALLFCALVTAAVVVAGVFGSGRALAYGSGDQPIAQVEISANCNNPEFPFCQEVGLGGVWAWAELDTAGGDGTSGDMDFTIAFCGHAGAGGGGAGGGGGPGEGEWFTIHSLADAPPGAAPFFDSSITYSAYYVLDFFPGSGQDDFIAVVPATYGHYRNPSSWPHGAQFQTQVAP